MTRRQSLGPLDPIYNVRIKYGAVDVGNTPASASSPSVTINQAGGQIDPAVLSPILYTVVFSEDVVGFATGDVTFSGTAGGTLVGTVSGTGATYTVTVTGMTIAGTVVATIAAGVCVSVAAGLPNLASTSTDNTVTWIGLPVAGAWGWWDATDSSTITASAGAVSGWADKSGNARHFVQTTGGNKPTTGTRTIGGLNALDFVQANTTHMTATGITNTPANLDEWTCYFVYQNDIRAVGHQEAYTLFGINPTAGYGGRGLIAQASRMVVTVGQGFATFVGSGGNAPFAAGNQGSYRMWGNHNPVPRISEATVENAAFPQLPGWQSDSGGTSFPTGDVDGAIPFIINTTNVWATTTANALAVVGVFWDSGAPAPTNIYDGSIAEIVIYRRLLNSTERNLVRTYLQVKYGL